MVFLFRARRFSRWFGVIGASRSSALATVQKIKCRLCSGLEVQRRRLASCPQLYERFPSPAPCSVINMTGIPGIPGLSRTSFLFNAPLIAEDPDDALIPFPARSSRSDADRLGEEGGEDDARRAGTIGAPRIVGGGDSRATGGTHDGGSAGTADSHGADDAIGLDAAEARDGELVGGHGDDGGGLPVNAGGPLGADGEAIADGDDDDGDDANEDIDVGGSAADEDGVGGHGAPVDHGAPAGQGGPADEEGGYAAEAGGDAAADGEDQRRRRLRRVASPPRRQLATRELTEWFVFELRVQLELDARVGGQFWNSRVRGSGISGGAALVFAELGDYIATWGALVNGRVVLLCSCGGVLGRGNMPSPIDEVHHPELLLAMGKDSTCRHAAALRDAYAVICVDVGAAVKENLFDMFPALAGREEGDTDDGGSGSGADDDDPRAVEVGEYGPKSNLPTYAVLYEGAWAPVIAKPRTKRLRLAFCCQLSCAAHAWSCIHANTVNRLRREHVNAEPEDNSDAGSSAASGDSTPDEPAPGDGAGPQAAQVVETNPAPRRRRRARNMFPCRGEVAQCSAYHAECDVQRAAGANPRRLQDVFVEEFCIECNAPRGPAELSLHDAILFTLRGRAVISVADWTCVAGHVVSYDGSDDALFAFEPRTVYTRVFLDAVLETCVIGRTTMSAAAELLTSAMRNSDAYVEEEFGQARQRLSEACGDFSDTLIIPDLAFTCPRCGEDEANGGSFTCVLCDGQVLSVLADHIVPMLRPGQDCPRAPMPITFACAVRNAVVRAVIRRRVRAGEGTPTALTARELARFRTFSAASEGEPPLPPPLPGAEEGHGRTLAESERALLWAAAHLFSTFFVVRDAAEVDEPADSPESNGVASSADEYSDTEMDAVGHSEGGQESEVEAEEVAGTSVDADDFGVVHGDLDDLFATADAVAGMGIEQPDQDLIPAAGGVEPASAPPAVHAPVPTETPSNTPPPNPDTDEEEDPLQFLLSAPQDTAKRLMDREKQRTNDRWKVPLNMVEDIADGATPSTYSVVMNPEELHSPLTLKAVEATNNVFLAPSPAGTRRRSRRRAAPSSGADDFVIHLGKIPVKRGDFDRILPGVWFTDQVVNAFVELLRHHRFLSASGAGHGEGRDGQQPNYFFNTYFYALMMRNGTYKYRSVRRWTRRKDVLACDKVFVPVNLDQSHWVLAVVEWTKGVVGIYDSLGSTPGVGRNMVKWAADEAKARGRPTKTLAVEQRQAIQQNNSDDCGMYMCMCMELLAREQSVLQLMQSRANFYRRRIAAQILSGRLLGG